MRDKCFNDLFSEWEVKEETVFDKKIILGDREIYPLNQITILYKKGGKKQNKIVSTTIEPIAWFIKEEDNHYALLFDEEKEDLFWEKCLEYKSFFI